MPLAAACSLILSRGHILMWTFCYIMAWLIAMLTKNNIQNYCFVSFLLSFTFQTLLQQSFINFNRFLFH